ncbi:MAG TPA: hypothetical protein PKK26_19695, partial [Candidatus Wallbacteria bacterium]|nr:hypothetical protein [Candidatus Wallbacteria bacterium]
MSPDILLLPTLFSVAEESGRHGVFNEPVKGVRSIFCFLETQLSLAGQENKLANNKCLKQADHCIVFTPSQRGTLAEQLKHEGLEVTSVSFDPDNQGEASGALQALGSLFHDLVQHCDPP